MQPTVSDPLFDHRRTPAERLLAIAGAAERAARALLRKVRGGQPPLAAEARLRWARGGGTAQAPPPAPAHGPPLLYLPALPWAYRFQRPQQLALALAGRGVTVIYAEAFLRAVLQPRVWVTAPAERLRVVRLRVSGRPDPFREPLSAAAALELAASLAAGLQTPPRAIVAQLPFWSPLARTLATRFAVPLVYDRIDLHTGFPGVPAAVGAVEEDLILAADLVTATSEALAELPRRLGARTVVLRNACDPAAFPPAPWRPPPAGLLHGPATGSAGGIVGGPTTDPEGAPVVGPVGGSVGGSVDGTAAGFVGALDDRIDAAALAAAARAHPAWRFRLAGRIESPEIAGLAALPNVELTGEIPHRRVAGFLAGLDVGVIPYRDTPLTRAIDPVKLYEMLAAGLPVALRRLPGPAPAGAAALGPPLVYPYRDPAELPALLARARSEDSQTVRERRREAAREESWDRRSAGLLAALAGEC